MADSGTFGPDVLARRAMIAQQLMNMGMDTSPIRSWTQGAARLAQALTGGMLARQDLEQQQDAYKGLAGMLGNGLPASPAMPPQQAGLPAPQATAAINPTTSPMGDLSIPRGLRNNNPLNIEAGSFTQGQPGYTGSDGRFAKFASLDQGLGAANALLDTYQNKYGLNTVRGIVSRWAPAGDGNNVDAYAADVAGKLGVHPDQPLTPEQRQPLIAAMAQHETGQPLPQGQPAPQAAPVANPIAPQGDMRARVQAMLDSPNPYVQRMGAQLAQQLVQQQMQPPEFKQVGQNLMGQPQFGWVNPYQQSVTTVAPTGAGGGQQAFGGTLDESKPIYNQLPKAQQSIVDSMLEGKQPIPSSFALKTPYWNTLLAAANERSQAMTGEPFDGTIWQQRLVTRKDFASGPAAKNVTSLNTVIGHLGDLQKRADALNNTRFPWVNAAINYGEQQVGDPRYNEFDLARNAVADELGRVFRQSGMSDSETRQWKDNLSNSQSPEQLKGSISTAISLMESRLHALEEQRRRGMSTSQQLPSILDQKSLDTLARVKAWANGEQLAPQQQPQQPQQPAPSAAPQQGGGLPQGWSVQVH